MTARTEEMTTAAVNGVQLAYKFHGTGEIPLVMVHGALLTQQNWDWVIPHLPDSFRFPKKLPPVLGPARGRVQAPWPAASGSP
jgi:pimeloyl-ACP methyl ester carboxylesterase